MHFGNIKVCRGTIISIIGGGVLGALAGGVVSYFLTKKIIDEKINECNCKVIALDDYFDKPIDEYLDDEGFVNLENDDGTYAEVSSNLLAESDAIKKQIMDNIILEKRYDINPEEIEEDEDDEDEIHNIFEDTDLDEIDAMNKAELMGGQPYVISYEEYFETCKDFVKTTIGWYPKEEILADENNEIIPKDEWADWVGDDGLNSFGQGPSHDGDVVFIRNPYTHHDYEVIRFTHETYSEEDTVGNMNE